MIDKIWVDDEIWGLRPDYEVLILTAERLAGGASLEAGSGRQQPLRWIREHDDHVAAWRDAYQAFGSRPKRTRPSADALLRRAGAGLPQVNRVVDAYNAVSVRDVLP